MGRNRKGKLLSAPPPTAVHPFDIDSNTSTVPESSANLSINLNCGPSTGLYDEDGWCYTVEQLEDSMVKALIKHYEDILAKLASLGYAKPLALRAVLSNGHCYCSKDAFSNILPNAVAFIEASPSPSDVAPFSDLGQLASYSLDSMICQLQQIQPQISHDDAVLILLQSHFDLPHACVVNIPCPCPTGQPSRKQTRKGKARKSKISAPLAVPPTVTGICRHQTSAPRCPFPSPSQESLPEHKKNPGKPIRRHKGMNIAEENAMNESLVARANHKMERILNRMFQFKELEVQLKERHDLAERKALLAAQKLCTDLAELKILMSDEETNLLVRNENLVQNNSAEKQLSEMGAVKQLSEKCCPPNEANEQVVSTDQVDALQGTENSNVQEVIVETKLNSVVSTNVCNQMAKFENESLKKQSAPEKKADRYEMAKFENESLKKQSAPEKKTDRYESLEKQSAPEKQTDKFGDAILHEAEMIIQLKQQLIQKETKIKLQQEMMSREEAFLPGKKKHNAKESTGIIIRIENEPMEEDLQQKIEVDFGPHKDNRKMKEEISCSEESVRSNTFSSAETDISMMLNVSSQMSDH